MTKLLDFYENVLALYNMSVDKKGYVNILHNNVKSAKMIDGKQLVLPTKEQLMSRDLEDKIIFHPIPENIARGESDVIKDLLMIANIRLNYTISALVLEIISLFAQTDQHSNLTPEQTEMLLYVGSVDKTALTNTNRVITAALKQAPGKTMANIYLKRGGTLNGKRYNRVGIVRFPFYDSVVSDEHTLYGIKVREKDRETYKKIFEYILPEIDVKDKYSFGSNSDFIPYLEALIMSTYNVASKLNDVIETFSNVIDEKDLLQFNTDFFEMLNNDLDTILTESRRIPSQTGNVSDQPTTSIPAPTLPAPTYQQPNMQLQQPMYQQPMVPMQPQYQQPMYQQPTPSGVVNSDGTVNLNAILASNPQLQQGTQNFGALTNQQPMMHPQYQQPMYQQPMMQPQQPLKPWQIPLQGQNNMGYQQYPNI